MKKLATLLAGNVVVLGFLVFLMNALSITAINLYNWYKPKQYANSHLLPNYAGAAWAKDHFSEYYDLQSRYEAYYGWRRLAYRGDTINIDQQGLRRTWQAADTPAERSIAFFGGSTTWGTGADDDRTIASEFVKLNPEYVGYNFGETGWVAHQSLNMFMKMYFGGFRPDVVVFYDGVNDAWHKCRRELDAFAHAREYKMRTVMDEASSENPESPLFLILPIKNFVEKLTRMVSNQAAAATSFYDCAENPAKAEQIARVLLSDWLIVKELVESYGGTFVPILQPVIYFSDTRKDHLELDQELRRQYEAVYPLVVELMHREFPALAANFMDLRAALDADEYFYIDWCHLSPDGNQLVAARISDGVNARTGKAMASRQ